jgi:hypothetical protein
MHGRRIGDMVLASRTRWCGTGGGNVTMKIEKLTALEAYRAGKLYLPPGYELEYGADVLVLRRGDGSLVAACSITGSTTPAELARTAEEDYRAHGKNSA